MNQINLEYPRPMLVRNSFVNLNGIWNYLIVGKRLFNKKQINFDLLDNMIETINVPFPIESKLSQVNKPLKKGEYLVYKRFFSLNDLNKDVDDLVLLHFGACDQKCSVYINRVLVKENIGGYLPFTVEISSILKNNNEIIVIVEDNLDKTYPYGKQSVNSKGIWYTKVSGIWKTVWMECVKKNYIEDIKIETNIDSNEITIQFTQEIEVLKDIYIYFNDELIKKIKLSVNKTTIKFDEINLWSPEEPNLYDVRVVCGMDDFWTYFGFRKISIGVNPKTGCKTLCLNNKPYYMHGLLDQGYFSDGIYTPSSNSVYYQEINMLKEYGFNTLRKHIKIENDIYYYLCDKLGMLVWQDFVNNSRYSFFFDTVLPTIGLKSIKFIKYKKKNKEIFIEHGKHTIDYLFNHPSIVLWTIFNEGWGQFDTSEVYSLFKEYDKTRVFDGASGWFTNKNKYTDLESLHIYFKPIQISNKDKYNKPLVISEFGGYSLKINNHVYSNKNFGYKNYNDINEYNEGILELYKRDIVSNISKGVCASIYTQVSDVEEEINGLLTYDREVIKISKEVSLLIRKMIDEEFEN